MRKRLIKLKVEKMLVKMQYKILGMICPIFDNQVFMALTKNQIISTT